jgi:hypothetical protein
MNQIRSLSDLTVTELRKVLQIKEQIATLENELTKVIGSSASAAPAAKPVKLGRPPGKGKRGGRRKMGPEARARIAAAQRARWAKTRGETIAVAAPTPGKRGGRRKMSPEARARIGAAHRARWAASRAGKPAKAAAPAKPAGKRGGRRKMSPEARERIAAAQRARWAASRVSK